MPLDIQEGYEEAAELIAEQFNNELTATGMLAHQYKQIQDGEPINLPLLFRQVVVLNQISQIVSAFELEFGKTSLTDYTGNQMTIKISESGAKSIGYLFGFIEKLKRHPDQYAINEYQAQETTLEQIFNQFAKEDDFQRLN